MMRMALGLAVGLGRGAATAAGGAAALGIGIARRSMGGEPLLNSHLQVNRGLQGLLTRGALSIGAVGGIAAGVSAVANKYTVTRAADGNLEPISDDMLGATGSMAFAMHKRAKGQ